MKPFVSFLKFLLPSVFKPANRSRKEMLTIFVLLLFSTGAWRFADTNFDLKIQFDSIYGLQSGDRVLFEENQIGKVESIVYERDGMYKVEVSISSNFSNAVTEHTAFYIVDDPKKQETRAIELVQTVPGGPVLRKRAVVDGSINRPLILKKLAMEFEKGIGLHEERIRSSAEGYRKKTGYDEYRKLRRYFTEMEKKLRLAGKET